MLPADPRASSPYCGIAPLPVDLVHRWHPAVPLLAAFAVILAFYLVTTRARRGRARLCFMSGWTAALLTLVSPLCALSVALCSARIGEHMILTTIAAPLVALGLRSGGKWLRHPVLSAAMFWGVLWFWHAPVSYDATFRSVPAFWLMQLTLFASAVWLWSALFARDEARLVPIVVATFMTTGQMGLLGAIITFAGRALYSPHATTTLAWGMTPLQDQQLAGVIMWVPAGVIFAGAFVIGFADLMRPARTRTHTPLVVR